MSILLNSLSVQQLRKAATLKEKIQSLEKEIGQLLGSSTNPAAHAVPKKKWKMSKAARARISAAAKARWAKLKGPKPSVKPARKVRVGNARALRPLGTPEKGHQNLRALVRTRWQFAHTSSHLAISAIKAARFPSPIQPTFLIFSPRTWSKSMASGGKYPPQSVQGPAFSSAIRARRLTRLTSV